MRTRPFMVRTIAGHQPVQAGFVEHDYVLETFATSGSNTSLDEGILPRRSRAVSTSIRWPDSTPWRPVYGALSATVSLCSCTVVADPSVARARRTYSPGLLKVAVKTAGPASAPAAGGLNRTAAGPRHTYHDTCRR